MSKPYFRPQTVIQQEFAPLAGTIVQPQNVLLVGPIYKVLEADDASDLLSINYGDYDPTQDVSYDYAGRPTGGVVDLASVSLVLRDVFAQYASLSGSNVIERGAAANEVTIPSANGFQTYDNGTTVFNRNSVFVNRNVAIGDRLRIQGGGGVDFKTRIIGFKNALVAAVVAAPDVTASQANQSHSITDAVVTASGTDHVLNSTGTYLGDLSLGIIGEIYTLECIVGGAANVAKFKVTSTKGDNVAEVAVGSFGGSFNVGTRGVTANFTSTGTQAFVVGETYTITAASAYAKITPSRTSSGSTYDGLFDAVYTVKVVKGGTWAQSPQVVVTTNNGTDASPALVVEEATNFLVGTLGITASIASNTQGGLLLNDTFTISATASKKGAVRTALIANPIPSTISSGGDLTVTFYIYKAEVEVPTKGYPTFSSTALEATADEFTVKAGIEIVDSTWTDGGGTPDPIPVKLAKLVVPYRALLTSLSNETHSLSELSAVSLVLGKVVEKNPMGYAVDKALANSGGQTVFYIPVATDDLNGYRLALGAHETDQQGYIIVPLSEDKAIRDLVDAHVSNMSSETGSKRCIGMVPAIIDELTLKYDKKVSGESWTGFVWEDPGNAGEFTFVTVPGATFLTDGIRATDIFRGSFGVDSFGNDIYTAIAIDRVIDEETLVLVAPGFSAAVGASNNLQRVQIVRNLSYDEQALATEADSASLQSRRIYSVFPDFPIQVAWHFLAAAVAGLASSVAPHQPITNASLNGFGDHEGPRKRFTPTQLDTMAQGGTMIITRPKSGGETYIRHQLSTDNTDDNRSELSVTRNLDSISDALEADLKQFIGRYNATEHLLQLVDTITRQKFSYFITETRTITAGPQLIAYNESTLKVEQNAGAKTQVDVEADLTLPLPVNRIHVKLRVAA